MIDLKNLPTRAASRLARCVPRRDAGGAIVWDIDLAIDISNESQAKIVETYVPGTIKQFDAGRKYASNGAARVSGGFDVVRVTFKTFSDEVVASGHADVRQCASNVKGDSAVLVIKVRLHGLLPHAAASLCYMLDECLDVHVEPQGSRPSSSKSPKTSDDDLMGKVIVIDDDVVGEVVAVAPKTVTIDTIQEEIVLDRPDIIDSIVSVKGPDNDLDFQVHQYKVKARDAGVDACWSELLEAISRMFAAGSIEPTADCAWILDDDVIAEAVNKDLLDSVAEA